MPTTTHRTDGRTPVQRGAAVVGAAFLLVGIAGFVPGLTSHVGDLSFAGRDSTAELLGTFQVSILHNVVHLLFGLLGLLACKSARASQTYLVAGGVLYLVLTLYGAAIDLADSTNFLPFNTADNWLHLGLGAGMVVLGLALSRRTADEAGGQGRARPLTAEGQAR